MANMFKVLKERKLGFNSVENAELEEFITKVGINKGFKDEEKDEFISLTETKQKEILTDIYNSYFFFQKTNRFVTVTSDFNVKYLTEKDFKSDLILFRFPEIKALKKTGKDGKFKTEEKYLINLYEAISMINLLNQVEKIEYKMNIFQPSSIKKIGSNVLISKGDFNLKQPKEIEEKHQEMAMEIIEDYKQHDKGVELFFECIIAPLFTTNRKEAYYYELYPSNAGKTHKHAMMEEIGACKFVKYDQLLKPRSPYSAESLFGFMYTVHDEFKVFKQEMKDITHNADIDAKGQLTSNVEMFGKFMASAELSTSFMGIVDDQIINRVPMFDKTKTMKKLTDRDLYNDNTVLYNLTLQNWFYYELTTLFNSYKEMGEIEAGNRATTFIRETHKEYKIKVNTDILTGIKEYIYENLIQVIHKFKTDGNIRYDLFDYITIDDEKDNIFISRPQDFVSKMISLSPDNAFKGKSKYKINEYEIILGGEQKVNRNPILQCNMRCIKLDINMINNYFNEKTD